MPRLLLTSDTPTHGHNQNSSELQQDNDIVARVKLMHIVISNGPIFLFGSGTFNISDLNLSLLSKGLKNTNLAYI